MTHPQFQNHEYSSTGIHSLFYQTSMATSEVSETLFQGEKVESMELKKFERVNRFVLIYYSNSQCLHYSMLLISYKMVNLLPILIIDVFPPQLIPAVLQILHSLAQDFSVSIIEEVFLFSLFKLIYL